MKRWIGNKKLLILLVASFAMVVSALVVFDKTPPCQKTSVFGKLALVQEPSKGKKEEAKEPLSKYHAIKEEQNQATHHSLRYKERKVEENPFFSFYKQDQSPHPTKKSKRHKKSFSKPGAKEEKWFFNPTKEDENKDQCFFEAFFSKEQQVQDGKALSMVLKEPILELNLEEGSILKGVPKLEDNRINIHITAGVISGKVRKLSLRCFDKEDCLEGVYHDELAQMIEEHTKEGVLDEVLNLDIKQGASALKGGKIVRKFSDLLQGGRQKIFIEAGKEVFVALDKKEE